MFQGLKLKPLPQIKTFNAELTEEYLEEIRKILSIKGFGEIKVSNAQVTVAIPTLYNINGNCVMKIVTFNKNGTWSLSLYGKNSRSFKHLYR